MTAHATPWYHDGTGRPSLTCELCRRPLWADPPPPPARCPRCRLLIEAHEVLPCQGRKETP
jgi:hypothetical protein